MRRNRMMALLLAGCMVLGHSNVLLYAEETDEQFYMIEEDEEPEIPEEDLVEEEEDLYATDLIEDEEEELYAAEIGDSEAPVFDASTIKLELPDGQSTVTGGDTVKLSVRVTDASGIDLAMVTYKMPTAGEKEYYLRYNDETQKYETSITISNDAQAGEWKIGHFFGRDVENNYAIQYQASDGEFSAGSFTVTDTVSDSEAPVFYASTIKLELPDGQSTVTGGDTVKLSVRVTDASGIDLAMVTYKMPTAGEKEYYLRYNDETQKYETSITISNDAQAGEWKIGHFFGRDVENNYAIQYQASDDEFSKGTFTVTGKCKITFDSRGGSEVENQYVLPGEKATEPDPQPTKEDYTFGGWYTDEELTVPFDFDTAINENTTIYAKWNEIPVTLTVGVYDLTNSIYGQGGTYTFNAEDMTHTADKHVVSKGDEVTLAAAPADGYEFAGWYEGRIVEETDGLNIEPVGEPGALNPTGSFIADQDVVLCAVFADENVLSGWCGDNVTYELNKKTGLLTIRGTGPMTEYAGTDLINPFSDNQDIKKIIVEDGVTTISKRAFQGCEKVTEVTLPDSVTEIGEQAFAYCIELERITLPQNITSIKKETFAYCIALQEIDIPESVSVVGDSAFIECVKVSYLAISENLTSIGQYAFACCADLTSISIDPDNPIYDSRNNCNAIIETASDTLITGCSGTVIPNTVKAIGDYAFAGPYEYYGYCYEMYGGLPENAKLTSINIPANVKEIGEGAFGACIGLTDITLHDGLQTIGGYAFQYCIALKTITIPDSVTKLGACVFDYCQALKSVSLPSGITEIKNSTFYGCSVLVKLVIPEGVNNIGSSAFRECTSLTEIDLPASLTYLHPDAFIDSGIVSEGGVINYAGSLEQWNALTGGSGSLVPQSFGAYDVTFNPNGGSEIEPQIVSAGDKIQKPENPTKDEDVFGGWFTDEALTEPFDFDEVIHADVTLYAKWLSPDTDFDLGNCTVTFDENYRVLDDIESTPYEDWFYVVPSGTILEPIVKSGDETLTSNYYKASYSECMFYEERNEWDKIDDNAWIDHFPTDAGVYFCKVEGVDPYYGSYEWIDLIRILPGVTVCTVHDFGPDQTIKATTTAAGRVYHVCKNCGMEETIKVLPKLKPATPTEKITVSKKPSIQKPAATKSKITVKWKHFKHTSKKTKKIWKKIKKVQVQCATDKTFKNIVKDVKIGRGKTKYAIKGLARKTTYYVRVRYYDGVGYSAWSKVKKAKTK